MLPLLAIIKKRRAPLSCSESWAITNCWRKSVVAVRVWCFAHVKRVSTAWSRLKVIGWSVGDQSALEALSS